MKVQAQLAAVVVVLLVLAVIAAVLVVNYNGIIKKEKLVEESASQIEVVCQRRLDLLPNLIETVKAYAQHERQTLEAVIKARSQAQGVLDQIKGKASLSKEDLGALMASQNNLSMGVRSLFALLEQYPDLKANSNFLALQDQFEGTENRISVARQRYNQAARIYNTKIEVFPSNIVAALFGFEAKAYFEAKKEALEPVKAQF